MDAILLKIGAGGRVVFEAEYLDQSIPSKGEGDKMSSDTGCQGQEIAGWVT